MRAVSVEIAGASVIVAPRAVIMASAIISVHCGAHHLKLDVVLERKGDVVRCTVLALDHQMFDGARFGPEEVADFAQRQP